MPEVCKNAAISTNMGIASSDSDCIWFTKAAFRTFICAGPKKISRIAEATLISAKQMGMPSAIRATRPISKMMISGLIRRSRLSDP